MLAYWGASALIACALLTDVRSMRIPNVLCAAAFAAALLCAGIVSGTDGLAVSLIGTAAGFVPMLIMYAAKGIGAGDVKLFGALGAWLGTQQVLNLIMYSILYAGAIGLLLIAVCRLWDWPERLLNRDALTQGEERDDHTRHSKVRFPFMLAVAPAAITCWFML